MAIKFKNGPEVSGSMGLLISILVRYPEVGTINYDPEGRVLKFTFLLHWEVTEQKLAQIAETIGEALRVYHGLEELEPKIVTVEPRYDTGGLFSLGVGRDIETLSQGEIALLIDLLHQLLGPGILEEDEPNVLLEDELQWQEEMISHMLDTLKSGDIEQQIFAFREEGRVMVYNK
ncbi:MAG: hypothetical protein PHC60_05855 [Heliobacteriaceae bacterium]|nr:hypothetical protein [Heliobacteriaceae bacterium]MDD4587889.1 hypothetical protein [Heliobacteriaceae bacterium]